MTAPVVELKFNPTGLRPSDLPTPGPYLGGPAEAIEAALAVARAAMVDQMRTEIRGLAEPTHAQLVRIADLAWQLVAWKYRKVSAPIMADAYIHAYRAASAGDVPMSMIYDLAERHAEKVGDYFHTSSRDALIEGFNLSVNRRIPAKAAADRVLDAYGLTPRQMRTYVGASQFNTPVSDVMPRSIKAKARAYIDKAFTGRIRKLSRQEEHNIDQQAQQFAWMWLQSKGRLSDRAEKLWITAKDERVCKICGPLHNKRVKVTERFVTAQGEFWTPGLHPNCRCVIRLLEHTFGKADAWDPDEHPRGGDPENKGRFSRARAKTKPYAEPPPTLLLPNLDLPIAEEEKTGTIDIGGGGQIDLGAGRQIDLGGAGKIDLGSEGKIDVGAEPTSAGQINLGAPKVDLGGPSRGIDLATPDMRFNMDAALTQLIDIGEAKVRQRPTPLPRSLYSKDVIRIQDDNGHQFPVYGVTSRYDALNWEGGQVELHHGIPFTASMSHIRAAGMEYFERQVYETHDDIMETGSNVLVDTTEPGHRWQATLDDADVMEIVRWTAYKGRVLNRSAVDDANADLSIEWEDQNGNRRGSTMKLSQLSKHLNLHPEEFDVVILRMDEGHDSANGETTQAHAGTKGGFDQWVTSGIYNLTPLGSEDVGHDLGMQMYQIDPDVEEEETIAWNVKWGDAGD